MLMLKHVKTPKKVKFSRFLERKTGGGGVVGGFTLPKMWHHIFFDPPLPPVTNCHTFSHPQPPLRRDIHYGRPHMTVRILTVRILTVRILTVRILTVRILTVRIMTVRILTVRIMTVRILTVRIWRVTTQLCANVRRKRNGKSPQQIRRLDSDSEMSPSM